jgi:TRAP-type mannitol/chloroaromatic compound transport system permease small subunit
MPEIHLGLPHWLYWSGLVLFPILGTVLAVRARRNPATRLPSLPFAYLMLVFAGFVGAHRIYLRTRLWWIYIPLVLGIIAGNAEIRAERETVSAARAELQAANLELRRAETAVQRGSRNAQARLEAARAALPPVEAAMAEAEGGLRRWNAIVLAVAGTGLALMVLDACLLPGMWRRRAAHERANPVPEIVPVTGELPQEPDPVAAIRTPLTDVIDGISKRTGEFIGWWALIAVFFYYVEVVLRYLFNSPTTFVHEAMFLMFGMMYLVSGGFALLEGSHVRVDIVYSRFSRRGKALADVLTSVFFFLFAGTLVATSWIYLDNAVQVWEVSFSDWGIQYWPIKAVMLLGSAILLLQGVSLLIKDVIFLTRREPIPTPGPAPVAREA